MALLGLLALPPATGAAVVPDLSEKDRSRLGAGKLVLQQDTTESETQLVGLMLIGAPRETVLAAVLDFASQSRRTSNLKTATPYIDVKLPGGERDIRVAYELEIVGRTVRYHLAHTVSGDGTQVHWSLDGDKPNDVEQVDGSFELVPREGATLAVYRSRLDTGMRVPDFVAKVLSESALKGYLRGVRDRSVELAK